MGLRIREIEAMSVEELKLKLEELRKEMMKHYAQISTGTTPKSPGQVRETRRVISRIFTVLNKKEKKKHE